MSLLDICEWEAQIKYFPTKTPKSRSINSPWCAESEKEEWCWNVDDQIRDRVELYTEYTYELPLKIGEELKLLVNKEEVRRIFYQEMCCSPSDLEQFLD